MIWIMNNHEVWEHNGTRNTQMEWKQDQIWTVDRGEVEVTQAPKMVTCHCGFQLFASDEYSNPQNRKEKSD